MPLPHWPAPYRLDPGRVRWHVAVRTITAALAALIAAYTVSRSAHLPSGMAVIATVVAILLSRTLHATSLTHRLAALAYVPIIGLAAGFTGRFMLQNPLPGAALYIAAVTASRYLLRFGGTVRSLGRLALTPLISVLVVPIPPHAARTTGPVWGGVAGLIATGCVVAVLTLVPARPTREAATAARDFVRAAQRLAAHPPGTRARARAERDLHRVALIAEDRLDASALADGTDRTPLDALSAALLHAEVAHADAAPEEAVRATSPTEVKPVTLADSASERPVVAPLPTPRSEPTAPAVGGRSPGQVADATLAAVRDLAVAVSRIPSRERPTPDTPPARPRRGAGGGPAPHTRLAAQLGVAMAAAFAAGHLAFPHRWTWTVITAFVISSPARGRGDVVHRSALRIGGAFLGAVTGTFIAHTVAGDHPIAVIVIFCYLLIGLWLRESSYAVWAFSVTSMLAVLYTLNGERGSALLVQRPEGILLGSVCGIAAAFFVLPLHTETVMRGRAARALQAMQDLLTAAREPEPHPAAIRRLARSFDRAARELEEAATPARTHRRLLRRPLSTGSAPACTAHAADWAECLPVCAHAVRVLAAATPAELAAVRAHLGLIARNLGHVRRRLGRRPGAEPPQPLRSGPPHLLRLNTALAELYHRLPAPPLTAPAPVPPPAVPAAG